MSSAVVKPIRVIHELTPHERFSRGVKQVMEQTDAGHARLEVNRTERIKALYKECFGRSMDADDEVPMEAVQG